MIKIRRKSAETFILDVDNKKILIEPSVLPEVLGHIFWIMLGSESSWREEDAQPSNALTFLMVFGHTPEAVMREIRLSEDTTRGRIL